MALVDLHCHLDLYPDPARVAAEVARRGIYALSVTTTPTAFRKTSLIPPARSRIKTGLGLHPELAASRRHELSLFKELLPEAEYIGEIGLDGSADHRPTLDVQGMILTEILNMCAREGGRIMSLHSRGAHKLILDVLSLEPRAGRPVLHWYTGTEKQVLRAAELGCWFSVGSAMLKSQTGLKAVKAMPRDKIVTETDGPFTLSNRRPAMPWDVDTTLYKLATIWGTTRAEAERVVTDNFRRLINFNFRHSPAPVLP